MTTKNTTEKAERTAEVAQDWDLKIVDSRKKYGCYQLEEESKPGIVVADIYCDDLRHILAAAPELLEACKGALIVGWATSEQRREACRAAIRKATGQ